MMDQHASERDERTSGDVADDANGAPTESLGHEHVATLAPEAGTGTTPGTAADGAGDVRPFANIAAADYVRDAIAALALLVSLALPWNLLDRSADRVEVVLAVALSLASLTLPYLARFGVLPVTWTRPITASGSPAIRRARRVVCTVHVTGSTPKRAR